MTTARSDPDFVPISPNPYIVGNPIRDPKMFFGREVEFDLIQNRFRYSPAEGGLIVLCGERRSGKTSILFQIMNGRLGPDFIPVLIDMQSMAIESETDFLQKIAGEVNDALPSSETAEWAPSQPISGAKPSAAFHKFVLGVLKANPNKKLILLFDEYELFENKIEAGTLSEDVLFILSNLMETRSVFLVFTGSLNLEERRKDYWRIFLGKSIYRTISFLDRRDALRLITEPVKGRLQFEDGVVEAVYRLSAGQPFYTQAVCQNIIDHLNEHKTNRASVHSLESVVANIVSNPFPQMIFLWEGLSRDEKLTLSLLGQTLASPEDHATAKDLYKASSRARYPWRLDIAPLSTALEALFGRDMLLKDRSATPGYAFRIDLWRHWVRRMHSVWQVMRELGIPFRGRRRLWPLWAGAAGLVAAAGIAILASRGEHGGTKRYGPPGPGQALSRISLSVVPSTAAILRDGRQVGIGSYDDSLSPRDYSFKFTATGYRDTVYIASLEAGRSTYYSVILRPWTGSVRILTEPAGAVIAVDGAPRGRSPMTVPNLGVPGSHKLRATLEGYVSADTEFVVRPDTTTPIQLSLTQSKALLSIMTIPPGARLQVDGIDRGVSNTTLELSGGAHHVIATLDGYSPVDTSVVLGEGTSSLVLRLPELPRSILVLKGDRLAVVMWVDEKVIGQEVFKAEATEVAPGWHTIRVSLRSLPTVSDSIYVEPGERIEYDYSAGRIISREKIPENPR